MAANLPGAQHLGEVEWSRWVELRVAARGGVTVEPPAHELRRVPEARALEVVVADLDHAFWRQRDEREGLLGGPAAGGPRCGALGPLPRVVGDSDHERLELLEQLAPALHGEGADDAHGREPAE